MRVDFNNFHRLSFKILWLFRILTKFKTIEDFYHGLEEANDVASRKGFQEMFHAFGLWLKDMAVLDEKLHIPSLAPNMLPELMGIIFEPSMVICSS